MTEIQRNKLLRFLGEDNANYSELVRQQADYIYAQAVSLVGSDDFTAVSQLLGQVSTSLGLRRPRLNRLYDYFKQHNMRTCGRYDYTTTRPPIQLHPYDRGWKL